jgi:hypothetical protein
VSVWDLRRQLEAEKAEDPGPADARDAEEYDEGSHEDEDDDLDEDELEDLRSIAPGALPSDPKSH